MAIQTWNDGKFHSHQVHAGDEPCDGCQAWHQPEDCEAIEPDPVDNYETRGRHEWLGDM